MNEIEEDLGMIFLPDLGLMIKVHKDKKGQYVRLPASKRKLYLKTVVDEERRKTK